MDDATGAPLYSSTFPIFAVTVDLVVLTIRDDELCVLLVTRGSEPFAGRMALPGGFVLAREDLDEAAARELGEETGIALARAPVLEQLKTYGAPDRDPRPERVVTVAHLAVLPEAGEAVGGSDAAAAHWLPVRRVDTGEAALAFDHRQIVADGVARAQAKLEYTALATAFLPSQFTINALRQVYETVWDTRLDRGNFHRAVAGSPKGFLTAVEGQTVQVRRFQAQLFRRREGLEPTGLLDYPVRRPQL